jgi:cysteine synthase A
VSLAFVCAALGYRLKAVSSDAFSEEKRRTMRAFGAEVVELPSDNRRINAELINSMIARSRELSRQDGHWWSNQLENADGIGGYVPLGEELWAQSGGRIDAFVHAVGTAHSIQGVALALRRHRRDARVVAVEPAESPVLSGGVPGSHRIEGIGIGFVPPLWDPSVVDRVEPVSSADGNAMARRLAREEGLFTGTSSGANVVAALRIAAELGPDATVATLAVDSGLRYLSTEVFAG